MVGSVLATHCSWLPLKFVHFIRAQFLPSAGTRKLLGPALSSRVIQCATPVSEIDPREWPSCPA
jgi:hypothetical protein